MTDFNASEWAAIEQLFLDASAKPGIDALAWIAKVNAPEKIKREVRALLGATAKAEQLVDSVVQSGQALLQQPLDDGETIGRYHVHERIGAGGMGTVYRALDDRLDRDVAIKIIHLHLVDDPELKARFVSEARAASKVEHANVCTVFEVDETPMGQPFIVMALSKGMRLDAYVAERPLTVRAVIDIAQQLSAALGAVHAAGIVHRDLKPANVLIDNDGTIKLIDFGISKFHNLSYTQTNQLLGTMAYMAPELFGGATASEQSDMWALGVVLYEMIAGVNPFQGQNSADTMEKILSQPVAELTNRVPNIPQELERLIASCLSVESAKRPSSCQIIRQQLIDIEAQYRDSNLFQQTLIQPSATTLGSLSNSQSARAERRQVTALTLAFFSNDDNGQEQLLQRLGEIKTHCDELLRACGGYLHRVDSNQYTALWGFPKADEYAVKKSIRCALALRDGLLHRFVESENAINGFEVRIGLHTGKMIISQSDDNASTKTLLGTVAQRSEEISHASTSNVVAISESTYQLAKSYLYCTPLDYLGNSRDRVFAVTAERSGSYVVDEDAVPLTTLTGRDHELGMLRDYWQRSCDGGFQIIELVGEAGIGKSRLVDELKAYALTTADTWISECMCDPAQADVSLHPIVSYLNAALQELAGDDQSPLDSLAAYLARFDLPVAEALPLFARLLRLDSDSNTSTPDGAPSNNDTDLLLHLQKIVTARAKAQPFLLIFEDLHWADPTTLELLQNIIEMQPEGRLMLLITRRMECQTPWADNPNITKLSLQALSKKSAREFILQCLGKNILSESQYLRIQEVGEGNPLYLEELAKSYLAAKNIAASDNVPVNSPLWIPDSLQDMLSARVDRLGLNKMLVQLGAVVGREFSYGVIKQLSKIDSDQFLTAMLDKLVDADIVRIVNRRVSRRDDINYRFKHALIQEAVYQSLLEKERGQLHGEIARYFHSEATLGKPHQPQIIARHFTLAGDVDNALHYWKEAGKDALRISAYREAKNSLLQALTLVKSMTPSPQSKKQELDIHMMFVQVLRALEGWTAESIAEHYTRAAQLCGELNLYEDEAAVLFGLWTYYLIKLELINARDVASQLVALAKTLDDASASLQAAIALGNTHYWLGNLKEAKIILSDLVDNCSNEQALEHIARYGQDPRVLVLLIEILLDYFLGDESGAESKLQQMLTVAQHGDHPFSLAIALQGAAWFEHHRDNVSAVTKHASHLIELSREHSFPFYHGVGLLFHGWSVFMQELNKQSVVTASSIEHQAQNCVQEIERGYQNYIKGGGEGRVFHSLKIWLQADIYLHDNNIDEAAAVIEQGLRVAYECEEKVYLAELLRLKAICLEKRKAMNNGNERARSALIQDTVNEALEVCRRQGNKVFYQRLERQPNN